MKLMIMRMLVAFGLLTPVYSFGQCCTKLVRNLCDTASMYNIPYFSDGHYFGVATQPNKFRVKPFARPLEVKLKVIVADSISVNEFEEWAKRSLATFMKENRMSLSCPVRQYIKLESIDDEFLLVTLNEANTNTSTALYLQSMYETLSMIEDCNRCSAYLIYNLRMESVVYSEVMRTN